MKRQFRSTLCIALCITTLASGCKPTQPFFFAEDGNVFGKGDLSHYMDVATDIEYPDVCAPTLSEVQDVQMPLTVANAESFEMWDLTLEEVTRYTLANSKVIRRLGGRISDAGSNIASVTGQLLQQNPGGALSTFDPALVESGNGTGTGNPNSGTGVEAALAEFDAQLDASLSWQYNDRPQNFGLTTPGLNDFFAPLFRQDLGNGTLGITKTSSDGTTYEVRSNTFYDYNNNGSRIQSSDWFTNLEAAVTHPLLQGRGTQYNRISGPISAQQAAGGVANQIDGVIISRIRHDVALTDFEAGIRDLMEEVEDVYWELRFAYHDLEARKIGRNSAQETWKKVRTLQRVGAQGGEADKEAQARSQYFLFHSQVQSALTNLFRIENKLRFIMGLPSTDSRLIRPIDEPTTARVYFDWATIHCEALARRSELRKQKWQVKRRELELIATKNHLLPRLDAVGRYRWLGAGDDLLDSNPSGLTPFAEGSNAFESLTSGNFQEWEMSLQFSMPIGFRRAMTGVRHHQLLLARERAVLEDLELSTSHELANAIRDVDLNYGLTQSNFNRRASAEDEVEAVATIYESGRITLDRLLDAQSRRAEAESAYFRSLVDYNRAILKVHRAKGSLLEYNGIYLAEGPWPGKAHFDALRRARQRDASTYLNYGFTRPNVISYGAHDQLQGTVTEESIEPTPVYEGPILEDQSNSPSTEQENIEQKNNDTEEVIPTPEGVTQAAANSTEATNGAKLFALPATSEIPTNGAETLVQAALETPLEVQKAASTTDENALRKLPSPASGAPNIHPNPYRQELSNWMRNTTRGLPADASGLNPLRNLESPHKTHSTWAHDGQISDEYHADHATAEAAPNAPIGARTKH